MATFLKFFSKKRPGRGMQRTPTAFKVIYTMHYKCITWRFDCGVCPDGDCNTLFAEDDLVSSCDMI